MRSRTLLLISVDGTYKIAATRASRLGRDLLKELKEPMFSDFTIVTADKQRIRTHKGFLARAPWFRNKIVSNPGT